MSPALWDCRWAKLRVRRGLEIHTLQSRDIMGRELFTQEWYLQDGDQVHGPNGNLLVLRLFLVISSWGGGSFFLQEFLREPSCSAHRPLDFCLVATVKGYHPGSLSLESLSMGLCRARSGGLISLRIYECQHLLAMQGMPCGVLVHCWEMDPNKCPGV